MSKIDLRSLILVGVAAAILAAAPSASAFGEAATARPTMRVRTGARAGQGQRILAFPARLRREH
ncbi:hypothetical protein [Streptomyces sp. NPDC001340]